MTNQFSDDTWHGWTVFLDELILTSPDGSYDVDLSRCHTSAAVLDWIAQIANKSWARENPPVLAGLVNALNDLVHPQANLCSHEREQGPIDPAKVIGLNFFRAVVKQEEKNEDNSEHDSATPGGLVTISVEDMRALDERAKELYRQYLDEQPLPQ